MKEKYKEYFQHVPEEGEVIVDARWFKSMVNLRMLQFSNVRLEGDFHYIPSAVKWLQWRKCSHIRLPSVLLSRELAVLDLAESKIERVWGWKWFWDRRKVCFTLMTFRTKDITTQTVCKRKRRKKETQLSYDFA